MIHKIIRFLMVPVLLGSLIVSCDTKEDEAVKMIAINDVTSRITSIGDVTGAGATLEIQGEIKNVERIIFSSYVVRKQEITETDNGISFLVPATVGLGRNRIVLIFPGGDRADTAITVIPRQTVSWYDPIFGWADTVVTVYGNNLDIISAISIGDGTTIEPFEKSLSKLKFRVPATSTTGPIKFSSVAGDVLTEADFIVCDDASGDYLCLPVLNNNGDFEQDEVGATSAIDYWLAGNGTRAVYTIVNSPGGFPGLGKKSLRVEITNRDPAQGDYSIQVVNENIVCDSGRYFQFMGKIRSDAAGRVVKITGGVSDPWTDMANDTTITLAAGWNEFSRKIWHTNEQEDNITQRWPNGQAFQMRLQINMAYPENDGAVFLVDDLRVVDIGPKEPRSK